MAKPCKVDSQELMPCLSAGGVANPMSTNEGVPGDLTATADKGQEAQPPPATETSAAPGVTDSQIPTNHDHSIVEPPSEPKTIVPTAGPPAVPNEKPRPSREEKGEAEVQSSSEDAQKKAVAVGVAGDGEGAKGPSPGTEAVKEISGVVKEGGSKEGDGGGGDSSGAKEGAAGEKEVGGGGGGAAGGKEIIPPAASPVPNSASVVAGVGGGGGVAAIAGGPLPIVPVPVVSSGGKKKSSRFRGVRFLSHRTGKPWRAEIWDPSVGRMTHVGCYEKEEEAAHAYEEAVRARAAAAAAGGHVAGANRPEKAAKKEKKRVPGVDWDKFLSSLDEDGEEARKLGEGGGGGAGGGAAAIKKEPKPRPEGPPKPRPSSSGGGISGEEGKTVKLRGVRFMEGCPSRPWQARISIGGRIKSLGYFATAELAKEAYERAAKTRDQEKGKEVREKPPGRRRGGGDAKDEEEDDGDETDTLDGSAKKGHKRSRPPLSDEESGEEGSKDQRRKSEGGGVAENASGGEEEGAGAAVAAAAASTKAPQKRGSRGSRSQGGQGKAGRHDDEKEGGDNRSAYSSMALKKRRPPEITPTSSNGEGKRLRAAGGEEAVMTSTSPLHLDGSTRPSAPPPVELPTGVPQATKEAVAHWRKVAIGLLFQESNKCQGQEAEATERKELLMKAVAAVRQGDMDTTLEGIFQFGSFDANEAASSDTLVMFILHELKK